MKTRSKILLGIAIAYILAMVVVVLAFGATRRDNEEFLPQNEFKLDTWISLPGPFDINKAVLYLVIAGLLTVFTMLFVARRMQQRPNRVQTFVEVVYTAMRDNITKANMSDQMAAKWFPFIGALFLFIWYSNLIGFIPLPVNSEEKINIFGAAIPAFQIYAATANLSIPLVFALIVFIAYTTEGIRVKGVGGYLKSLIPAGVHGPMVLLIFPLEVLSNLMRIISLSVRLFANMLAGHLIILFMAGGLAILLGTAAVGVFLLPLGWAIYLFEVGLVATLQAFIFATLSAIYLGGSVAESH
jgi:F-type H+-transporting ATPase subunit a